MQIVLSEKYVVLGCKYQVQWGWHPDSCWHQHRCSLAWSRYLKTLRDIQYGAMDHPKAVDIASPNIGQLSPLEKEWFADYTKSIQQHFVFLRKTNIPIRVYSYKTAQEYKPMQINCFV